MRVLCFQRGLSLLEMLIALTILAILTSTAIPSFQTTLDKQRTRQKNQELLSLLQLARSKAVTEGMLTTVCPLDEQNVCVKHWNDYPISLFLDPENQKKLTNEDALIQVIPPTPKVELKAAPAHKSYFQFDSLGASHGTMGNLSICNQGEVTVSSRQIVINLSGRARTSVDKNGDGLSERSNGDIITC